MDRRLRPEQDAICPRRAAARCGHARNAPPLPTVAAAAEVVSLLAPVTAAGLFLRGADLASPDQRRRSRGLSPPGFPQPPRSIQPVDRVAARRRVQHERRRLCRSTDPPRRAAQRPSPPAAPARGRPRLPRDAGDYWPRAGAGNNGSADVQCTLELHRLAVTDNSMWRIDRGTASRPAIHSDDRTTGFRHGRPLRADPGFPRTTKHFGGHSMTRLSCLLLLVVSSIVCGADTDVPRPAAIQTEDVPPIPPQFAARLMQYQNTRSGAFAGWSPDGNGLLLLTRFGNSTQLHRVYEPGGRREQITFFDEPANGHFIPKAKDGAIVVSMSRGGSENDQLYLLDRTEFKTTLLTDGKSKNDLEALRPDGQQMIFASNRRNGRDTDLFIADPRKAGSERTLLETNNEFWTVGDWSQDGKSVLLARYVSINEGYPAIIDAETGKKRDLPLPSSEKAAIGAFKFTPDGKKAFIACDADSEFKRLAVLDLGSGKYEWLTGDIKWDVSDIEVDKDQGNVAFTVNADGVSQLYLLEPQTGGKWKRRELEFPVGRLVASLEFSPDGKHLGFTLAKPSAPGDTYSIELATGKLTRWTYSEVGGLNPASFVTAERIRFPSFDKIEIPAWYYRPRTASRDKKAPVV